MELRFSRQNGLIKLEWAAIFCPGIFCKYSDDGAGHTKSKQQISQAFVHTQQNQQPSLPSYRAQLCFSSMVSKSTSNELVVVKWQANLPSDSDKQRWDTPGIEDPEEPDQSPSSLGDKLLQISPPETKSSRVFATSVLDQALTDLDELKLGEKVDLILPKTSLCKKLTWEENQDTNVALLKMHLELAEETKDIKLRHRVLCKLHMLMRFLRAKGQGESSTEIQELLQPPSPQPDCTICFLPHSGPRQSPYMVLRKKYCVMDAYMCIICPLHWKIFVRFVGRRYWIKKIKLSNKSDWTCWGKWRKCNDPDGNTFHGSGRVSVGQVWCFWGTQTLAPGCQTWMSCGTW